MRRSGARSRPDPGGAWARTELALAPMLHRRGSDEDLAAVDGSFLLSTLPDGWRCLAVLDGDACVRSRAGHDLAPFLPELAAALASLAPERGNGPTILDGILVLPPGDSLAWPGLADVSGFAVLDAPCVAGRDLTALPLAARHEHLRSLRWPRDGTVRCEPPWRGDARASLAQLENAGRLAGGALLARRAAAPYLPGRSTGDWLSFGEPDRAEMVLCGIASSGALVLGMVSPHGLMPGGLSWPTRRWRELAQRCREGRPPFAAFAPWPSLGAITWAEPEVWLALEPDVRPGSGRGGPRWRLLRVQEDLSVPVLPERTTRRAPPELEDG